MPTNHVGLMCGFAAEQIGQLSASRRGAPARLALNVDVKISHCQMCVQCCSAGLRSAGVGTKQGRQLLINGLGSWMWEGAQKCAFWQH